MVTLDRPPANAMNRSAVRRIGEIFLQIAEREDPPPVVITGAGGRFYSAGGDIKELEGVGRSEIDGRMRDFHAMLVAMDRYPRPVVAAVNGFCVGGGVELASFADVVLAAPHARFGFPEIRHGLLPAEKGIARVIRVIGMRAARELLLSGDLIGAEQATTLGLVDTVVEPDRLVAEAVSRAQAEGGKAPVLYAALKRAVNNISEADDERWSGLTLRQVAAYFDDPVARSLRERWSRSPKVKPSTPSHTSPGASRQEASSA
ncbi:enoyl-CoA hydratase/isomerase family protein [Nocardioides sp. AN3]